MQHQPQGNADKHRRENPSSAKTAGRCHHQRRQFDQRKKQVIGDGENLAEGHLLHLIQPFKQRNVPPDSAQDPHNQSTHPQDQHRMLQAMHQPVQARQTPDRHHPQRDGDGGNNRPAKDIGQLHLAVMGDGQ